MKADQLPLVTLDLRHAGELLAHPCQCGRNHCTLGTHIWQATRDMDPGPKAQNTDPKVRGHSTPADHTEPDPALHLEYRRLVTEAQTAAQHLTAFIGRIRPDRILHNPPILTTAQDWCRNHLNTIGVCEPRYRGDLCRFCYDVQLAEGTEPPQALLVMRHRGDRLTTEDVTAIVAAAHPPRTRKRKGRKMPA
jgi:hypothetical protein